MTYCGNVFVYLQKLLQAVRTEKAFGLLTGQQASKSTGLLVGTGICSSIKTRLIEVCTLDRIAIENTKPYHKQFIARNVVQYSCIFTHQIYLLSPKRLEKIKPAILHNIPCNNLYLLQGVQCPPCISGSVTELDYQSDVHCIC